MSLGSRYAFYGCSLRVTSKCLIALSLSSCALQDLQVCSSNMLLRALVVSTCAFQVCSACVLFQLIFCVCSISVLCKSAFCMCSLGGCSATCSCGPSSLQKKGLPHISGLGVSNRRRRSSGGVYQDTCLSLSLSKETLSPGWVTAIPVHMSSFRKPLHFFLRSIGIWLEKVVIVLGTLPHGTCS